MTADKSGFDKVSRRSLLKAGVGAGAIMAVPTSTALAYDFPSTNGQNRSNGWPHVNQVSTGNCEVTLEFKSPNGILACFEYRVDGEVKTSGTSHPVVDGDYIYPNICTGSGGGNTYPNARTESFEAAEKVEVRLALGAERDYDFDWTTFTVPSCNPQDKEDCKGGGWEFYGFRNQGQCIQYVNTGEDSR
jgi:hypothetical protein